MQRLHIAVVTAGFMLAGSTASAGPDFHPDVGPELAPVWELMSGGRQLEALALVKERAEAGAADAQHLLGLFHEEGYGVRGSLTRAAELYHAAASQGYPDAFLDLSHILMRVFTRDSVRRARDRNLSRLGEAEEVLSRAEDSGLDEEDESFWRRMRSLGSHSELRWIALSQGVSRALLEECRIAGNPRARPSRRANALAWCRLVSALGADLSPGERRELDALRVAAEEGIEARIEQEAQVFRQKHRLRLIAAGRLPPLPPDVGFSAGELIPLRVGNRWTYRVHGAPHDTRVDRVSDLRLRDGMKLYRFSSDPSDVGVPIFLHSGRLGTYIVAGDSARGNEEPGAEPMLWILYPVSQETHYDIQDFPMLANEETELVETPVGRFRCIVYETIHKGETWERLWAAPGVGIVRFELFEGSGNTPTRVEELVSFELAPAPAAIEK